MLILALDSTALVASAAVAEVEDGALMRHAVFTGKYRLTHSETLLPMAEQALSLCGAALSDVDLLAVNVGPGSFTGVRIGVSTVKGLAFPRDLPCVGVSTLASLAEPFAGMGLPVLSAMDARRGQFYAALFASGSVGSGPDRLSPDACLSADEVRSLLASAACGEVLLCGDGASVLASAAPDLPVRVVHPAVREQNALAGALCAERSFRAGGAVSGKELRPVYLRVPQAERERLAKGQT